MTRGQREIVIEFEKVQTIRKRAKTTIAPCADCGRSSDSISLIEAARLFETACNSLLSFIKSHECHYRSDEKDEIYLCVTSLLERIRDIGEIRRLSAKE